MSYRKLNIDGQQWQYKIGRSAVHLRGPDGKGQVVTHDALLRYRHTPLSFHVDLESWRDPPSSFKEALARLSTIMQHIEHEERIGPADICHWIKYRHTSASIYKTSI